MDLAHFRALTSDPSYDRRLGPFSTGTCTESSVLRQEELDRRSDEWYRLHSPKTGYSGSP